MKICTSMPNIQLRPGCLFFLCSFLISNLNAQNSQAFNLESITFHSRLDDERSPDISVNIYSNRKIEIVRTVYEPKGQIDTAKSGAFKGELKQSDFNKLLKLVIQSVLWSTTQNIDCWL